MAQGLTSIIKTINERRLKMPLTPCLRCPRCGSSEGPGCRCWRGIPSRDGWLFKTESNILTSKVFKSDSLIDMSVKTLQSNLCPICGKRYGHYSWCSDFSK